MFIEINFFRLYLSYFILNYVQTPTLTHGQLFASVAMLHANFLKNRTICFKDIIVIITSALILRIKSGV